MTNSLTSVNSTSDVAVLFRLRTLASIRIRPLPSRRNVGTTVGVDGNVNLRKNSNDTPIVTEKKGKRSHTKKKNLKGLGLPSDKPIVNNNANSQLGTDKQGPVDTGLNAPSSGDSGNPAALGGNGGPDERDVRGEPWKPVNPRRSSIDKTVLRSGRKDTQLRAIDTKRKSIFVSRLRPVIDEAAVKCYIDDNASLTGDCKCTKMKTRYSSYSSFHISVRECDFSKVFNADLWPEDTFISEFRGRLKPDQHFKETPNSD